MADGNGQECPGKKMTDAVAPYGVRIDIRDPDTFALWTSRRGLRCELCNGHMQVYRRGNGNRYLRHRLCGSPRLNRHERNRPRYWLRDRFLEYGLTDVAVRQYGDSRYPHVSGTRGEHRYAVMVQYDPLSAEEAGQRTDELVEAGYDQVLWLTHHCDEVEHLPSLGISGFAPDAADDYHAHTGFLVRRAHTRGLDVQCCSLREFLRRWIEPDTLAWAHLTPETTGWAAVTDWKQITFEHLRIIEEQNARIRQLEQQLAALRSGPEEESDVSAAGRQAVETGDARRIPSEVIRGVLEETEDMDREPPEGPGSESDVDLPVVVREPRNSEDHGSIPVVARATATGRTPSVGLGAALVAACLILILLSWLGFRGSDKSTRKR